MPSPVPGGFAVSAVCKTSETAEAPVRAGADRRLQCAYRLKKKGSAG